MTRDIQLHLQQISNVLLMNGGFLSNPGLFSGDMGLVLFFAHYARYTQNDLYMEYCYGLMETIQNKIHKETPINYKQGLTGIGSVIEYLVQNEFFEADTDDILEDFDKRIFFTYNLSYLSIDKIMDIGYYTIWRLSGNSSQKDTIRLSILPQIVNIMEKDRDCPHSIISFYRDIIKSDRTFTSIIPIWFQLCQNCQPDGFVEKTRCHWLEYVDNNDLWCKDMGIQDGLAGWGFSLLNELGCDNSWITLFPNDFLPLKNESLLV